MHAEHPNAQHWDVERYEPAADEYGWERLADWCNSREDAEAEANRLRREQDYSGSITEPRRPRTVPRTLPDHGGDRQFGINNRNPNSEAQEPEPAKEPAARRLDGRGERQEKGG